MFLLLFLRIKAIIFAVQNDKLLLAQGDGVQVFIHLRGKPYFVRG